MQGKHRGVLYHAAVTLSSYLVTLYGKVHLTLITCSIPLKLMGSNPALKFLLASHRWLPRKKVGVVQNISPSIIMNTFCCIMNMTFLVSQHVSLCPQQLTVAF